MDGEAIYLRVLEACAPESTIDREEHAALILHELERSGSYHRRLDEHLLDLARFHVPEKEEDQ